jgi:hypothetical protein
MNLEQLIQQFRVDSDDMQSPPLWESEWIAAWLTEAQDEAAIRGRLLMDDYTPALTQIPVTAGVSSYALHPKLYEIAVMDFIPEVGYVQPVYLTSREKLDRDRNGWRNEPAGVPCSAIQTDTRLRLVPVPSVNGTLRLEAYRLPLKPLANDTDKPEIHEAHHRHLVHWALHRAFSKPDSETIDPQRAAAAEDAFARYFGPRPDADLRRSTRHDEVQTNKAFWV